MLNTITITTNAITDMCCYTCCSLEIGAVVVQVHCNAHLLRHILFFVLFFSFLFCFCCIWFLFVFLLYVLRFNICVRSLNFLYSLRCVFLCTICKLITNTKFCICVRTMIGVFLLFIHSFLSFQVIHPIEDNNISCR